MARNIGSGVSAADWLSQTHVKNYRNFSRVVTRLFSVVDTGRKNGFSHIENAR